MRLIVTGGAGDVGTQLCRYLRIAGHEVISVDRSEADGIVRTDLCDGDAARRLFEVYRPEGVLHLAANKNVIFCEENPNETHAINFGITELLTRLCAEFNVRMIFFSSDYVFGREDRVWHEMDAPCPTTQYGRDKVSSEQAIQKRLSEYAIVRTAGLYGFPGDLVRAVRSVLSKGETFNAFENLINCPTSISELFQMLDVILKKNLKGIFHCVGPSALSRFEYARSVAVFFGWDASLVQPESLDFLKDVRPSALRLNGELTYRQLDMSPSTLEENLKRMIDEYNR